MEMTVEKRFEIMRVMKRHEYESLKKDQTEIYLTLGNPAFAELIGRQGVAKIRCGNTVTRYDICGVDVGFGNPNWGARPHTQYVRLHIGYVIQAESEQAVQTALF